MSAIGNPRNPSDVYSFVRSQPALWEAFLEWWEEDWSWQGIKNRPDLFAFWNQAGYVGGSSIPVTFSGRCLTAFHAPPFAPDGTINAGYDQNKADGFFQRLRQINPLNPQTSPFRDFRGIVTSGFENEEDIDGIFDHALFFGRARFRVAGAFGSFRNARFMGGDLIFSFSNNSYTERRFANARFLSGNVQFKGQRPQGALFDFGDTLFSGGSVDFSNLDFGGHVNFSGAQFHHNADFRGSKQHGFGGKCEFQDAVFHGDVDFSNRRFEGQTYFIRTRFDGIPRFHECEFHQETYFTESSFHSDQSKPIWDRTSDAASAGTQKRAQEWNRAADEAERASRSLRVLSNIKGNQNDVLRFYVLEMDARSVNSTVQFVERFALCLYKLTSNYATSLAWTFGAFLLFLGAFSFGAVYSITSQPHYNGETPDFWQALLFVLRNFSLPPVVWGDLKSGEFAWANQLKQTYPLKLFLGSLIQALILLVFVALFALTLRRKFQIRD